MNGSITNQVLCYGKHANTFASMIETVEALQSNMFKLQYYGSSSQKTCLKGKSLKRRQPIYQLYSKRSQSFLTGRQFENVGARDDKSYPVVYTGTNY